MSRRGRHSGIGHRPQEGDHACQTDPEGSGDSGGRADSADPADTVDIDPRPAVATHPLAGSAPSSPSAARLPAGLQSPPIHRSGEVSSTQDEAARRLDAGEQAPFAVTARRQQAGRGRLGRRFVSPDGGNVYLTYAHSTRLAPSQRTWMPLVAGLAAVSAVDEVAGASGVRIGLKWPNDLQTADGRKLGGILVEGRGAHGVLIGIGINLHGPVRDGDGTVVPGAAWLLGEAGIRDGAESAPGDSVPAAAAPVAASPPGGTQRPEQNEELGDRIADGDRPVPRGGAGGPGVHGRGRGDGRLCAPLHYDVPHNWAAGAGRSAGWWGCARCAAPGAGRNRRGDPTTVAD